MVLHKRLEFGFNGYNLPVTPRATRSARRRGTFQKRREYNQMGAFNLLASVAGNVLLEKEKFASSTSTGKNQSVKIESLDTNRSMKSESSCDEGSSDKRCNPCHVLPPNHMELGSMGSPNPENDVKAESSSLTVTSGCLCVSVAENLVCDKSNQISSKLEVDSSKCAKFSGCQLDVNYNNIKEELHIVGKVPIGAKLDMYSVEDPVEGKNFAAICSNSSAMFSSHDDHIPRSGFSPVLDDAEVVRRDDDENPSRCTQWGTTRNTFSSVTRIGNRKIRKILASKYWKPPLKLKNKRITNADGNSTPIFDSKDWCNLQSSQVNIPFKKKKNFLGSSDWNPDVGEKSDDISYLLRRKIGRDAYGSSSKIHGVRKVSSSMANKQSSDCNVKLKIKSFRVPELFVEIPETATVGSLKRTVMEAVTTILGGGLRVGIILQGKKVRDDDKTLIQSGISRNCEVDALGFTLEPNSTQKAPSICPAAASPMVPCLDNLKPLARYSPDTSVGCKRIRETYMLSHDTQLTKLVNSVESDHDLAPSLSGPSADKDAMASKVLVPVAEKDSEAFAIMVPAQSKTRLPELVQRRIRRPFSVAEVESLVQAVEKLGTGRWRDVKLHAFDNTNHRNYVDLKDKWKTLVHTARISPKQRRGEPVPQELLDRVLAAHAYWSQQQIRQNHKLQEPDTSLLI